jgi:hypothetical protein
MSHQATIRSKYRRLSARQALAGDTTTAGPSHRLHHDAHLQLTAPKAACEAALRQPDQAPPLIFPAFIDSSPFSSFSIFFFASFHFIRMD